MRSPSRRHARIVIQNGLTWKIVVTETIGSNVTDWKNRANVAWPANDLMIISFIDAFGKPLKGFYFLIISIVVAVISMQIQLKNQSSMIEASAFLKKIPTIVAAIANRFINNMALHLLSLTFTFSSETA